VTEAAGFGTSGAVSPRTRPASSNESASSRQILRCPVCPEALARAGRAYVCPNQHAFDLAREGYVNLLLAHQKASRNPGDSPAMIRSRQQFLAGDYFAPLATRITAIVGDFRFEDGAERQLDLLDAGCGEGYYLRQLRTNGDPRLVESGSALWGLDISKEAIRLAARRDQAATYLVASVHSLPFLDGSLDYILQVFAPTDADEFARVLQPAGEILIVRPGPDHLAGLKQILFEEQSRPHSDETEAVAGFDLIAAERLSYDIQLGDAATIEALLGMTPYYWTSGRSGRDRLIGVNQLATRVDFSLTRYRRQRAAVSLSFSADVSAVPVGSLPKDSSRTAL
jgi:23S rRNA (guanine745-N1)-methyltransferase